MSKSFRFFFLMNLVIYNLNAQLSDHTYGLYIISNSKDLKVSIDKNSEKSFVNLKDYIPGISLDIKYATKANIFYEKLYTSPSALLRLPAAKALKKVQEELKEIGYGIKVYDAYRPYKVTCRMFAVLPDTIYMGLPWKGSKHNRGIALDLTIIDLKSKKELVMPTPFDALVYASHPEFKNLPENAIRNRDLLIQTMHKYGFKVDPVEWWHFNFQSSIDFEILDISHRDIENMIKQSHSTN